MLLFTAPYSNLACFCAFIVYVAAVASGAGFSAHVARARQLGLENLGYEEA